MRVPHEDITKPTKDNVPKVGIVVVNFRCLADTIRCFKSLKKLDYRNFFVVLIDNFSQDGSVEELRGALKEETEVNRFFLIFSPENRGFAAGSNLGIKFALSSGADYVWLVNPDAEVMSDSLGPLVNSLQQDLTIAATGSKIYYGHEYYAHNKKVIWGAGGTINRTLQQSSMNHSGEIDSGQADKETDCGYIPGCSMLIRSSALDKVGYLPEQYFMYFEETDWCLKATDLGYRLRYVPKSIVLHHTTDNKMQQAFTIYYYNRNQRLFWFRYGEQRQKIHLMVKTILKDLPRNLWALLNASKQDRKIFSAHLWSCIDFILFRTGRI